MVKRKSFHHEVSRATRYRDDAACSKPDSESGSSFFSSSYYTSADDNIPNDNNLYANSSFSDSSYYFSSDNNTGKSIFVEEALKEGKMNIFFQFYKDENFVNNKNLYLIFFYLNS